MWAPKPKWLASGETCYNMFVSFVWGFAGRLSFCRITTRWWSAFTAQRMGVPDPKAVILWVVQSDQSQLGSSPE